MEPILLHESTDNGQNDINSTISESAWINGLLSNVNKIGQSWRTEKAKKKVVVLFFVIFHYSNRVSYKDAYFQWVAMEIHTL